MPTLLRIFGFLRLMTYRVYINTYTKSASLAVEYSPNEAFALPIEPNKQQETYADMTKRLANERQSRA